MTTEQYANGNINNIDKMTGNINIHAVKVVVGSQPVDAGLISDEQIECINGLAESFGRLELDLLGADKSTAPLLKHIAFKAAGVSSLRKIPSSKNLVALGAMRDYIQKQTKACQKSAK